MANLILFYLQVLKDDGLPYKICNTCKEEVKIAYAYKRKCEESDLKLRKYLEQKYLDLEIKKEHEFNFEIKAEQHLDEDPLHAQQYKHLKDISMKIDTVIEEEEEDGCFDVDDMKDLDYIFEENDLEEKTITDKAKKVNGRLMCHICDKSLADKRTLKLHIRLHTGKNLKKCLTCGRGFAKQSHLSRHMQSHLKKEYACDYCDEKFDAHQVRRLHLLTHNIDR